MQSLAHKRIRIEWPAWSFASQFQIRLGWRVGLRESTHALHPQAALMLKREEMLARLHGIDKCYICLQPHQFQLAASGMLALVHASLKMFFPNLLLQSPAEACEFRSCGPTPKFGLDAHILASEWPLGVHLRVLAGRDFPKL